MARKREDGRGVGNIGAISLGNHALGQELHSTPLLALLQSFAGVTIVGPSDFK